MSDPVMSAVPEGDYEWSESEKICPKCGKLMWQRGWWDDPPELGGACIGWWYECGDCKEYETC